MRNKMSLMLWMLAGVYGLLLFTGLLHHEMWQDEMHHFLLARDSAGLSQLFHHARLEGHPPLWNLLLYGLVQFTNYPQAMQVLNGCIALLAVFIFLRNAPFTTLFKALFVCGYFILFEYGMISRNYALCMLFLFAVLSTLASAKRSYALLFACILGLASSHLFGLICAIPLWILAVKSGASDENRGMSKIAFRLWAAGSIVAFVLMLWMVTPAGGHMIFSYDTASMFSSERLAKAMTVFMKGLLPLPDVTEYHWWNTNWFAELQLPISLVFAIACLVLPALLFYNRPVSLQVFYGPVLVIAAFLYFSPLHGGVRYSGFVFLLFVSVLWVEKIMPLEGQGLPGLNWARKLAAKREGIVIVILAIHASGGAFAWWKDFQYPFSEGKQVAEILRQSRAKNIIISDQTAGPSVSGYLGKKVFYPETKSEGSFCRWDIYPFVIPKDSVIAQIHMRNRDGYFLKNDSSFGEGVPGAVVYSDSSMELTYLRKFDSAIVRTENYWIYNMNWPE